MARLIQTPLGLFMIQHECICGRTFLHRLEFHGCAGDCPECGKPYRVPSHAAIRNFADKLSRAAYERLILLDEFKDDLS